MLQMLSPSPQMHNINSCLSHCAFLAFVLSQKLHLLPFPFINPNCMSSILTCSLILFSITFSTTFIACSKSLIALYDPHPNGSPLPLYTGKITLPFQSSGMVPSVTIALHSSVNHSTPTSSAACNISATTLLCPAAFPFFILASAFLTSAFVIRQQGPSFVSQSVLLSHSFSSFNSFSIYPFQIPGILLPSITIFSFESFRQFTPSTSCLSFAICFAIRNTFLFSFSLSNSLATSFLLFSFASATAFRALILASL